MTIHHETKFKLNAEKIERIVYATAALILIGHIFFISSTVSGINVALILAGAVFGLMFATGTTPFVNTLTRDGEASISADIFPFVQNAGKHRDVDERHAA